MKHQTWMILGAAVLAAACSRPQPVASGPTPQQLAEEARRDSLERLALADSAARADSLARQRTRAEVVNEQVQTGMVDDDMTSSGLPPADSVTIHQLIYFDYDSDRIRPEYERLLEAKLGVLRANPQLEVRVGGHADDRGADEYNMVLGLRRASSVHRWLVNHGIAEARITVMSFGEEQPLDAGQGEAAWSRNRRADFVVTRPAR